MLRQTTIEKKESVDRKQRGGYLVSPQVPCATLPQISQTLRVKLLSLGFCSNSCHFLFLLMGSIFFHPQTLVQATDVRQVTPWPR